MEILIENTIKICLAVLVGGSIGAEREFQDKAAGLGEWGGGAKFSP